MKNDPDNAVCSLIQLLRVHFDESLQQYNAYLKDGKKYRYACGLMTANQAARKLLIEQGHILPEDLQPDAAAIIQHYQEWTSDWKALEALLKPGPEDQFVFPTRIPFPKESAKRLENYCTTNC